MPVSPVDFSVDSPARRVAWLDAVAIVVGIVIGTGIFAVPNLVALNTATPMFMMLAWLAGGLLCVCGALCYGELATTYPHSGGEYVYLARAFGPLVGFLFVWSRMAVIQTGSIAAAAYVFGSYAAQLRPLGTHGPLLYALAATVILTLLNALGLRTGRWTQRVLTCTKVLGLAAIVVAALLADPAPPDTTTGGSAPPITAFGLALVFVLYTFGGWNEAAYVAGEVRRPSDMLRVLFVSMLVLTAIYVAVNLAYLRVLGFEGVRGSGAVAADTMYSALGAGGRNFISALVAISTLGAMNGSIFTGARTMWALGHDFRVFAPLARWHTARDTPLNAILLQGAISTVLILLPGTSSWFRDQLGSGFESAVMYTAPVFWTFLLLVSIAVIALRYKDRKRPRPFRVPLYPLTVLVFALTCGYMVYSALDFAVDQRGHMAWLGVGVMLTGLPVYFAFGLRTPADAPAPGWSAGRDQGD